MHTFGKFWLMLVCVPHPSTLHSWHRFEAAVIAAENAAHVDPKNMEVMLKLQKARAVASARTLGNDLYKAGKMLEASVAYSEGLQYDPINAILLCNRAACRCDFASFLANLFLILVCLVWCDWYRELLKRNKNPSETNFLSYQHLGFQVKIRSFWKSCRRLQRSLGGTATVHESSFATCGF